MTVYFFLHLQQSIKQCVLGKRYLHHSFVYSQLNVFGRDMYPDVGNQNSNLQLRVI